MVEGPRDRRAAQAGHLLYSVRSEPAPNCVAPQRQGQASGRGRPALAKVAHALELLALIGQTPLVNEERRVDFARANSLEHATIWRDGDDDRFEARQEQ